MKDLPKTDIEAVAGLWSTCNSKEVGIDYMFCRAKGCNIGESLQIVHRVQTKTMLES